MADFPEVPYIATQTNYSAGPNPWNGAACKTDPGNNWIYFGWTPATPVPAQHFNWWANKLTTLAEKAHQGSAIKLTQHKTLTTGASIGGLLGMLPHTKMLMGVDSISGGPKWFALTRDGNIQVNTATVSAANFAQRSAAYKTATAGKLAIFDYNAVGSTGTIYVIADTKARAISTATPPTLNARYNDGCTCPVTGNAILLSGSSAASAFGLAYGDPSALSYAARAGWTGDDYSFVCPKASGASPGVYVWSKTQMYNSLNGGATTSAISAITWDGAALAAGYQMCKPTYNESEGAWYCAVAHMSTDAATSSGSNQIWRLASGTDWEPMYSIPGVVFTHIHAHKGWLWAIGRPLDGVAGSPPTHDGLEIYYSRESETASLGAVWHRTGIVLTTHSEAYNAGNHLLYMKSSSIVDMDNFLLFQTAIGASGLGTGADATRLAIIQTEAYGS